jgi:hypothetical protein
MTSSTFPVDGRRRGPRERCASGIRSHRMHPGPTGVLVFARKGVHGFQEELGGAPAADLLWKSAREGDSDLLMPRVGDLGREATTRG